MDRVWIKLVYWRYAYGRFGLPLLCVVIAPVLLSPLIYVAFGPVVYFSVIALIPTWLKAMAGTAVVTAIFLMTSPRPR